MCVGREHFNLCECGCPEIIHEEDFITGMIAEAAGFLPQGRGKCHGEIPLNLSIEEIRKLIDEAKERGGERPALTKPCDCKKFVPLFKPMCTGFGA
jgi:hypothetical protein